MGRKGRGLLVLVKLSFFLILTGCQIGYIAKSAYYQADLLRRRVPIESASSKFTFTPEQKEKVQLAMRVREFMATDLGLTVKDNYGTYVHLDRDYVTYAVSAAPKDRLDHYKWTFPIIGSVPYKGYFTPEDAKQEADLLKKKGLDVHVRGVTAYSTLGWFADSLLYSMLNYKKHRLVDTLIHETVHANLYINSESSFNERVASYLGQLGTEAFYEKLNNGSDIKALIASEQHDSQLFSSFISKEIKSLRQWYKDNQDNTNLMALREDQFKAIQKRFVSQVVPQLKTENYGSFKKIELNNARLLLYDLYMAEFSDFENVAKKQGRNFKAMFKYLKTLESAKNPIEQLKKDGEQSAAQTE